MVVHSATQFYDGPLHAVAGALGVQHHKVQNGALFQHATEARVVQGVLGETQITRLLGACCFAAAWTFF